MKKIFERLYAKNKNNFFELLERNLKNNKKTFIVTANPETFVESETNENLRKILLDSNVTIVPDGIGIVKASKMLNHDIKERIPGIDIAVELLELGNKLKKTIFLFGV